MRMFWWRLRTRLRLLFPGNRALWRATFRQDPVLHAARHFVHERRDVGYQTMAGYYNDKTVGGFMTPALAKKVYG